MVVAPHLEDGDGKPPSQSQNAIALSPRKFKLAWFAVLLFHIINAAFLGGAAALYWYITTPLMAYFIPALALPSFDALHIFHSVYLTLAVCHGLEIVATLAVSAFQRRFSFSSISRQSAFDMMASAVASRRKNLSRTLARNAAKASERARTWWRDLFGIDGRYFELTFELREALEIALQAYQAYCLSKSIASAWINTFTVAAIFINCFSTPIVHHVVVRGKLSEKSGRLLCVTVDCFLDFCNAVIVPFAIFLPYWSAFIPSTHDFAPEHTYDDVWYINAVQENRQVLITSPLDFVSTIVPHISMLLNLRTIKKWLVTPRAGVGPVPPDEKMGSTASPISRDLTKTTRYLQFVTCCWGMAVVVVHLIAQHQTHGLSGCSLHNNAWFVRKHACAVVELSCYQLNTTGSAQILDDQLALIDEASLAVLAIAHCRDLYVPTRIRTFPHLYGIGVFNSTITKWDDPNSLHRDALQRLNYLLFVHTNFSDTGILPFAMTHSKLPPTLQDIEIANSNLRSLPDNIDDVWQHIVTLYIEFGALEVVLPTLFQLTRLQNLSLFGNRVVELPEDAFSGAAPLLAVTLSSNPLAHLPLRISNEIFNRIQEIDVERTAITDLPDWTWRWLSTRGTVQLSGHGSPMCELKEASKAAEMSRCNVCATGAESGKQHIPVGIVTSHHTLV